MKSIVFLLIIREEMQVGSIDIRGSSTKKYAVDIRVRDEHSLMKAALNSLDGIDIMYTIEISPPLLRNSVFVLPIEPLEDLSEGNFLMNICVKCQVLRKYNNQKMKIVL